MYIGSWHTRVQVPKAAALTRPSLSAVVISTRQELGAKMLSHHSGRTSILVVMNGTKACCVTRASPRHARPCAGHPRLSNASKVVDGRDISAFTRVFNALCPAMTKHGLYVALKRAAEQVVKRDRAAAVDEKIERHDRPHQGVFEAELIPEVFAHPPALDIAHDQEQHDRQCGNAREQAEREQRAADELRERDRGRPEFAGPVAVVVELVGELGQIMGAYAGLGKEPEGVAQPMRHQRKSAGYAQERLRPGRERLVERPEGGDDEGS